LSKNEDLLAGAGKLDRRLAECGKEGLGPTKKNDLRWGEKNWWGGRAPLKKLAVDKRKKKKRRCTEKKGKKAWEGWGRSHGTAPKIEPKKRGDDRPELGWELKSTSTSIKGRKN